MTALNPNIYAYLWNPTRQMLDKNGRPLVGGYVMINMHGTTGIPALSYSDWNGTLNARQILLDSLGRANAIVENDKTYDLYVYNRYNVLEYSSIGVNCEGEGSGSGSPLRFTSSDGSVVITRTNNIVDLKVHEEDKNYGTAVSDSVGANGLIEFDTIRSGNITVVSAGTLQIEAGKLYHITVALEFQTSTFNAVYCDCQLVDSENTVHKFTLDASRSKQMVELSWDAVSTASTFQLRIQAPAIFTVTSAELYIHSVNSISGGSNPQIQSNWNETDIDSPAFIRNKPDISEYARIADLAAVAFSGSYDDLSDKPNLSIFARSADLATVATTGSYNDLSDAPAHLVQDADYVHTDNNFTDADKTKLDGIEAGADVNVQSDWNETDSNKDSFILNKPSHLVQDSNYVHTDNNFTNSYKTDIEALNVDAARWYNFCTRWPDSGYFNRSFSPGNLIWDGDKLYRCKNRVSYGGDVSSMTRPSQSMNWELASVESIRGTIILDGFSVTDTTVFPPNGLNYKENLARVMTADAGLSSVASYNTIMLKASRTIGNNQTVLEFYQLEYFRGSFPFGTSGDVARFVCEDYITENGVEIPVRKIIRAYNSTGNQDYLWWSYAEERIATSGSVPVIGTITL